MLPCLRNMTKSTYQLRLLVRVPVYNPNFLKVRFWRELAI